MTENRKVKLTKKVLKDTLVELLLEKNISSVTVTELCKAADVNRSTFYSHYETLVDVLDDLEKDFLAKIPIFNAKDSISNVQQHYITFIGYAQKHQEEYTVLLNNRKIILPIYNYATSLIDPNLDKSEKAKQEFIIQALVYGTFPMIDSYLKDNKGYSTEEFAKLLLDFVLSYSH